MRRVKLIVSTFCAISADDHLTFFSYFSQKTGFNISCRMSHKRQWHEILNPVQKNQKNIIHLSSAQLTQSVVKLSLLTNSII